MKNYVSIFILVIGYHLVQGQTVQRTSLNSGGVSSSASGISITSSFGQPFSAYSETPAIKMYLGFQQNILKSVASIHQLGTSNSMQVYPNPFVSDIYINTETKIKVESIRLINITGQEIFINSIKQNVEKYHLQLGDLPAGIYFLQYTDTNQQIHFTKLLK